jgi:hypothetical protein
MSSRWILVPALVILLLTAAPALPVGSEAPTQSAPEVIRVGIYLIRAGSLDITTGGIDVDFYIEFTCPSECGDKADFEIINGTTKSKPVLLEDQDSATQPTYRVAATVFQNVDLRKYPFDSHDVKIVVESSNYDSGEVMYEVNEQTTAIDPNVFILGWTLDPKPSARIVDQHYEAWDLHYSRYEFTAHLSKPALAGWLKGLLPAIFIAAGSMFALFITIKNIANRVAIITSALVASVLYHLNFTSRVPPIGYLTFGDIFMIVNYVIILISLGTTIWILRNDTPENQDFIKKIHRFEVYIIPSLWLGLHILNAAWIL